MNDESRDRLQHSLDHLAREADQGPVGNRMAGIARKARRTRRRQLTAGIAGIAVLVAGAVGVVQFLPSISRSGEPEPIKSAEWTQPAVPTPTSTAQTSTAPTPGGGLTVDLDAQQVGPREIGVIFRAYGTSLDWYDPQTRDVRGMSGPSKVRLLVDGEQQHTVNGADGLKCRKDSPVRPYDLPWWEGEDYRGRLVEVDKPGTHTVTVEYSYCGAGGNITQHKAEQHVTVGTPELAEVDQTAADIDGDGSDDQITLLMPEPAKDLGQSRYLRARVVLASGETTEIALRGAWTPSVAGEADLDGKRGTEVMVRSTSADGHGVWTVLTFADANVQAAVASGESGDTQLLETGTTDGGSYQHTFLRDGRLQTWHSELGWDQKSATTARLMTWKLINDQLHYEEGDWPDVCITPDQATWDDPQRC